MIGLEEMVLRAERSPFAGRSYRYGSRLRISLVSGRLQDVTAYDCGFEGDDPVVDYVTATGNKGWCFDSQVMEVISL